MKSFQQLWAPLIFIALSGVTLSGCGGLPYYESNDYNPPQDGVYHEVEKGQTLYSIARAYGMDVAELQRVNGIWDPESMEVGMHLWIPGAKRVVHVPPTVEGTPGAAPAPAPVPKKKPRVQKKKITAKVRLMWPVKGGVLTSRFGTRDGKNHHGIDIGARKGTPILAAEQGTVKFSGWGPRGYGLIIIIKHPGNLTTVYAHNSRNLVKKGYKVKRGQMIARIGKTGRATGPHLHFEVRNDTHPKNPLKYLNVVIK